MPALLQRLQRDAGLLRARADALQDALSQAGPAAVSDHGIVLREQRDIVQQRMRESVSAMETIRLGLLRLHAGSLTLELLTTHVGLASEMSAHMERLLSAQTEVRDLLRATPSAEPSSVTVHAKHAA